MYNNEDDGSESLNAVQKDGGGDGKEIDKPTVVLPSKTDQKEISIQTDEVEFALPKPDVSEVSNQTEQTSFKDNGVQTNKQLLQDSVMQTDIKELSSMVTQTDYETVESEMQTDIKEFNDIAMQAVSEQSENVTQTEVCQRDIDVQTFNPELLQSFAQTEHLPLVETDMQTDIAPIVEGSAQTENPVLVDGFMQTFKPEIIVTEIQTDISVALRCEQTCQTIIDVADSETQVTVPTAEGVIQTDEKEMIDVDLQVEVSSEDQEVQATIGCTPMTSQTDISMALQEDNCTQVELVMQEQHTQVELVMEEQFTQVELTTSDEHTQVELTTEEQCTQVEPTTDEQHTQVELTTDEQQTQVELNTDERHTQVELDTDEQHTQVELSTDEQHTQVVLTTDEQHSQTLAEEFQTGLPLTQSSDGNDAESFTLSQECLIPDECRIVTEEVESANNARELKSRWVQAVVESRNKTIQANGPDDPASTVGDTPLIEIQPTALHKEDGCQTDPVTIIIGDASFLMKRIKSSAISPSKVTGAGNEIEIEVQADEGHMPDEKENAWTRSPVRRPPSQRPLPATAPAPRVAARGVRTILPKQVQPTEIMPVATQPRKKGPIPAIGGKGKYSCPFCTFTFHESPGLYEHLALEHESDTITNFRKPKGREGKTIVPQKPTPAVPGGTEPQMPVLVPVVSVEMGESGKERRVIQHYQVVRNDAQEETFVTEEGEEEQVVVVQTREPGLFEDPVEPVRRVRRIYKTEDDEEEEDDDVEEHVVENITLARSHPPPAKIVGDFSQMQDANDEEEYEEVEIATSSTLTRNYRTPPLVVATPALQSRKRKLEPVVDYHIQDVEPGRSRMTRKSLEQVGHMVSPAKRGRGRPPKRGRR